MLQQMILESFERHASRPALWCDDRTLSYHELGEEVAALAGHIARETGEDARVGIATQGDTVSIASILAVVLSGRSYVPLNPGYPEARLQTIVEAADVSLILTTPAHLSKLSFLHGNAEIWVHGGEGWQRGDGRTVEGDPGDRRATKAGDAAYFMFTSGTSGKPKGVRVNVGNLEAYLRNIEDVTRLTPQDKCSHFFERSFDLSVHDIFVTLCAGAQLVILPGSASLSVVDFVNEQELTCWFSVPSLASFCDRMGALKENALPSLRLALFCGEALPVELARKFSRACPDAELYNLYGPTEATIAFTQFRYDPAQDLKDLTTMPIGYPLGEQSVDLLECEHGHELALGGPQVTPGYINNDEQQAAKFYSAEGMNWYRTGDVVRRDDDLGLLFAGRVDDQVKINGYRVELMEVDAALRKAANSPEAASIIWNGADNCRPAEIIGFVVGSDLSPGAIRKACRQSMPSYMVPRKVITLDEMPTNSSGKIDRSALRTRLSDA